MFNMNMQPLHTVDGQRLLSHIQQLESQDSTKPLSSERLLELSECCVQAGDIDKAYHYFARFMSSHSQSINFLSPFCRLLHRSGYAEYAAKLYGQYCEIYPNQASFFYNYAYYLRFAGAYEQAIQQYERALSLNISQPEEVYLNIAVIYSDHLRNELAAKQSLLQSLKAKPDYLPALYNLANLAEEMGDKQAALTLFNKIISIDADYFEAYARLADILVFNDEHDSIIENMLRAARSPKADLSTQIDLHFALGKAFDDCKAYEKAFEHYNRANALNSATMSEYSPGEFEDKIQQIINTLDSEWLKKYSSISDAKLIFICGMFRSGSTLIEQILAQHNLITPGGENEFFKRTLQESFPQRFAFAEEAVLKELAQRYLDYCKTCYGEFQVLTDKRPDNYLFLGLLKALFPNAKFIFTQRNKLDNCLSVYFLRLGQAMNYANNLEHIIHYYDQHELLMSHWKRLFGADIYTLNYDQLVKAPEATLKPLLEFLGLDYQPELLQFHHAKNAVKTASVWQVRRPLYQHASGRSSNYVVYLKDILRMDYFENVSTSD